MSRQVILENSSLKQPVGSTRKRISDHAMVEATIYLKPEVSIDSILAEVLKSGKYLTRQELSATYKASPENIKKVVAFAESHGLNIIKNNTTNTRAISVHGSAANIKSAFGVNLNVVKNKSGKIFHTREGFIKVDANVHPLIEGVFGLDTRPKARTRFQILDYPKTIEQKSIVQKSFAQPHAIMERAVTPNTGFYPTDLAKLYNFPTDADGTGQCIGIIELGGGHTQTDLDSYFTKLNLTSPNIVTVGVDGVTNTPVGNANSADGEVMLDIEVAGGIAPNATIAMYYAPNTDIGFLDAITTAINDTTNNPSVISISWGNPEQFWTVQSLNAFNDAFKSAAAIGVTITVAAGDAGSSDGVNDGSVNVDFPASSPYVLACGGTKIILSADGNSIDSEIVWNEGTTSAGGGGVSDFFALPDYQAQSNVPTSFNNNFAGRGLPDVSADADPATGYKITVDGGNYVFGGTSAVAPLMAGLIALTNQILGKNIGFIHPIIYADPLAFRDIVSGNNTTTSTNQGFTATKGWDAASGLGVADGNAFVSLFQQSISNPLTVASKTVS